MRDAVDGNKGLVALGLNNCNVTVGPRRTLLATSWDAA